MITQLRFLFVCFFLFKMGLKSYCQDSIYTGKKSIYTFYIDLKQENPIMEIRGVKYAQYDFLSRMDNNNSDKIIAKSAIGTISKIDGNIFYCETKSLKLKVRLDKALIDDEIDYFRKDLFERWIYFKKIKAKKERSIDSKKIENGYKLYKSGELMLSEDMDISIFLK